MFSIYHFTAIKKAYLLKYVYIYLERQPARFLLDWQKNAFNIPVIQH